MRGFQSPVRGRELDADLVREAFSYDPETGVFRWKIKAYAYGKVGSIAGSPDLEGYRRLTIAKQVIKAHRVAWLLMTGEWPDRQIDHINGDPTDNRWVNLRLATHVENGRNRRLSRNNSTGAKGVTICYGRYRARITVDGECIYLGMFGDLASAAAAYRSAARHYFGAFERRTEEDDDPNVGLSAGENTY